MKFNILLITILSLLLTACSLKKYDLKTDLDITSKNKAYISGKILKNKKSSKPYYLVLFKVLKNEKGERVEELVDFSTHIKAENFEFIVNEGTYFIYACQNPKNITEEKLAHEYLSNYITLTKNSNRKKLNIKMNETLTLVSKDNILIETSAQNSITKEISYEEIRSLDDVIFNRKNASTGLWNPLEFLQNVGGGIYMLEKFKENKTAILFIHGMSGTPKDFEYIIKNINKNKFQSWVYYYPSGLNLNYSVDILNSVMDYIKLEYQVKELIIIAHSMGGLLARGFINIYDGDIKLSKLITISTPWKGQKLAKNSLKYKKYLPPSFSNMVPDSAYQKRVLNKRFPKDLEHSLLFGYKGKSSFILEKSNDGTISLNSQLSHEAQTQAKFIYGFDENHISILNSKIVVNKINSILEKSF